MGELFARIWKAPAETFVGMVLAGLVALVSAWADAPQWVAIGAPVAIAFLGAFSDKKIPGKGGKLPLVLAWCCALCLAFPSCTQYADGRVETDPEAVKAYADLARILLDK